MFSITIIELVPINKLRVLTLPPEGNYVGLGRLVFYFTTFMPLLNILMSAKHWYRSQKYSYKIFVNSIIGDK
jgi:hypothetical protein